jgi:hypothetical protein
VPFWLIVENPRHQTNTLKYFDAPLSLQVVHPNASARRFQPHFLKNVNEYQVSED